MRWVKFENSLRVGIWILSFLTVRVGLSLGNSFHVWGISVFRGDNNAWVINQSLGKSDGFEIIGEDLFQPVSQGSEHLLELLEFLSFQIIIIWELEVTLSDVGELLLLVLSEVLEGEFIDWVVQKENFVSLLEEFLEGWGIHELLLALTSDEVDVLLSWLGSSDILVKRGKFSGVMG